MIHKTSLYNLVPIILCLCGCVSKQSFSNQDARYVVTWKGKQVDCVECWSDQIPSGFVEVRILRKDSALQKVSVNQNGKEVWGELEFTGQADIGRNRGIVFSENSVFEGASAIETREWLFETNGITIYKEISSYLPSGVMEKQEFYGPFGVALKPPENKGK
jgi:hypothetical protein